MENRQEATEIILRNRCALLPLFSRVFVEEPNAELVELLACDDACAAVDLVATEGNGLSQLVSLLRSLPQDDTLPAFVDDARAEYTALFYGPQKPLAPYWESAYLDPRELLFLESTADVKKRYESEGFRVNSESRVAEDSLAFELDFLSQLAHRTVDAFSDGDDAEYARLLEVQLAFERDHLLNWLPAFAERAQNAPTTHLYPALCAAASSLIATDATILEELAAA